METASAHDLCLFIVAPNLKLSATTWRPCGTADPVFLEEASKALQVYTGYQDNSQLPIDEATAFAFGMQVSHRSFEQNGAGLTT